jgi:hypothetical protein
VSGRRATRRRSRGARRAFRPDCRHPFDGGGRRQRRHRRGGGGGAGGARARRDYERWVISGLERVGELYSTANTSSRR